MSIKYYFTISKRKEFKLSDTNKIFPQNFSVTEENECLSLVVTVEEGLSDSQVFNQVQQECDRIFFLTAEEFNPEFKCKCKLNNGGSKTCQAEIKSDSYIVAPISQNIARQKWDLSLSVQLRLWQLASIFELSIATKINLLFQIIEIYFPDTGDNNCYPEYTNSSIVPYPRTEAKLLRNLSSHGKKSMNSPQVKEYCSFLGIPAVSYDPTDPRFTDALEKRFSVIKEEARNIIAKQITTII